MTLPPKCWKNESCFRKYGRKKEQVEEKLNAAQDFVPTQDMWPSAERKIIEKKKQLAKKGEKRKILNNNIESFLKIYHMKVEN